MSEAPDIPHSPDLPAPHPSYILYRVLAEAILAELPPKKASRILEAMALKLADEENMAQVFSIRPSEQHSAYRKAQRQAVALFKAYTPIFLARIGKR